MYAIRSYYGNLVELNYFLKPFGDRTKKTYHKSMNGNELIKKLKKAGYNPRLDLKRGKAVMLLFTRTVDRPFLKTVKKKSVRACLRVCLLTWD